MDTIGVGLREEQRAEFWLSFPVGMIDCFFGVVDWF